MKNRKNIPLYAVCAAAAVLIGVILFASSGGSTRAQLIETNEEDAQELDLSMSRLTVRLRENGKTVESLLGDLEAESIDPGKNYEEKLAALNDSDEPEYVRMIIRKYWKDADDKRVDLDPALISLTFGEEDYNAEDWTVNPKEHTAERDVYYLNAALPAVKESALLFDRIRIDSAIADLVTFNREDNVIIAEYEYNSLIFAVEAEVQSVQFEHGEAAAASAWGVENVAIVNGTVQVGAE